MYSEIVAAITSTRAAIEIVKATRSLANYSELLAAVTTVQEKLTDAIASELVAQEKQAQLLERVRELEKQLAEVEGWESEAQRYQLIEFPETKALAYKVKPGMEQGELLHYLCTSCFDKKQKSTLQPNGRLLRCQLCKGSIQIRPVQQSSTSRHGSWTA